MMVRVLVLAYAINLAGCRRTEPAAQAPAAARSGARLDSSLASLCASPPDTSARGTGGCVLRDQGRVIGPRKAPPR